MIDFSFALVAIVERILDYGSYDGKLKQWQAEKKVRTSVPVCSGSDREARPFTQGAFQILKAKREDDVRVFGSSHTWPWMEQWDVTQSLPIV